jgi:3-isopropylmalate/(R)-2-methylmalate dehydratase small subunit
MQPFTTLTATAAALPMANVDTDKILAAQYLKTVHRAGLGKVLFASLRQDPGFVLNRTPWDRAGILIAGENFGCGSSREHAPWALLDFGIRCVIAPSIADIFYNNCFKNGILAIRLPSEEAGVLMALAGDAGTATMVVDLAEQAVTAQGRAFAFAIDAKRKHDLLNGIDEIAETLKYAADIDLHEGMTETERPWLRGPAMPETRAAS